MWPLLLLGARLLLAGVFATAGLAKLADLRGSRQALVAFGLPGRLAAPLGLLLPVAEVVIAGLLLPAATARWGAMAALGLLLTFAVAIGATLARGRTPDCHCFGQLHSRPVGPAVLARTVALAAVAGVVVLVGLQGDAGPGPGAAVLASRVATPAGGLLLVAVLGAAGLGATVLALLRQNGRLLLRVEALEAHVGLVASAETLGVDQPAPAFALPSVDGEEVTLGDLTGAGRPVLLVFSDPACGPCQSLYPDVAQWQRRLASRWTTVLVSRGRAEAHHKAIHTYGLQQVLLQRDREVSDAYHCEGTPGAVLVDAQGRVASPLLRGAEAIRAWVTQATAASVGAAAPAAPAARPPVAPGLPVGAPVPDVRLPMLDGPTVGLSDLCGTDAVLVLWNPRCGYCQAMLPDLLALDAAPDGPRLVVISSGTPEAVRAQGFQAPVLLDGVFAAGRALGAAGTPSAVRIDADGRIASDVVIGAADVLALARAARAVPVA